MCDLVFGQKCTEFAVDMMPEFLIRFSHVIDLQFEFNRHVQHQIVGRQVATHCGFQQIEHVFSDQFVVKQCCRVRPVIQHRAITENDARSAQLCCLIQNLLENEHHLSQGSITAAFEEIGIFT